MKHFYCHFPQLINCKKQASGNFLEKISQEEGHHLVQVLRAKAGDKVTLFDGLGSFTEGILHEIAKKNVQITFQAIEKLPSRPVNIHLAQGLPKGKVTDSLLRKATELGISSFIPLISQRSEVHLDEDRKENKLERWSAITIEACKQSKNLIQPVIQGVSSYTDWLKGLCDEPGNDLRLIASLENGSQYLRHFFAKQCDLSTIRNIYWLIGPEGDFTPSEYALAKEKGFQSIRLAPYILKVETAIIYALSVTDAETAVLR